MGGSVSNTTVSVFNPVKTACPVTGQMIKISGIFGNPFYATKLVLKN